MFVVSLVGQRIFVIAWPMVTCVVTWQSRSLLCSAFVLVCSLLASRLSMAVSVKVRVVRLSGKVLRVG